MPTEKSSKSVYDQRYRNGYREVLTGFEIARWHALNDFIPRFIKNNRSEKVLDYGAGQGLHVKLWEDIFPDSELHFCDISEVSRERFSTRYPDYTDAFHLVQNGKAACADNTYDLIVSIEVMEHVEDLRAYLEDIYRLLKPNGLFIWTTPCANRFSIEHIFSAVTNKIETTEEGYIRWSWEDPTHLRRMKSREVADALKDRGFANIHLRFRAHLFSFICTYFPFHNGLDKIKYKLMCLDYILFKSLPNGASMIGVAQKQ